MRQKDLLITFFIAICIVLSVCGCSSEPKPKEAAQPAAKKRVVAETTVLATIADKDEPALEDPVFAGKPIFEILFNEQGLGVVYVAKKAGMEHVVHNGKTGEAYEKIYNLTISPDGQRVAYVITDKAGKQRMVLDGREERPFDDVGRPSFSPDSRHIAYRVGIGQDLFIVVNDKISRGYKTYNGNPIFSPDSASIAYPEGLDGKRGPRLIISDREFKNVIVKENCGDYLIWNDDKTRLAAIQQVRDKRRVIDFSFAQPEIVREGPLYKAVGQLVFGPDGASVSYVADKDGALVQVLNNKEHPLPADPLLAEPLVVRGQKDAVAIMADKRVEAAPQALYIGGTTEKYYDMIMHLTFSSDGSRHAYAAKSKGKLFLVVNGREGQAFDAMVKPMFSPDGKFIVCRARQAGKRFVVVADSAGKILRQHPAYEMVFDTVFTDDGKSVAYGVKDGRKLIWKVEKLDSK